MLYFTATLGSLCAQTLPANWRVQPAGTQVALDSLPLSAAVSPDGKFLLALNAGSRPSISVVETARDEGNGSGGDRRTRDSDWHFRPTAGACMRAADRETRCSSSRSRPRAN